MCIRDREEQEVSVTVQVSPRRYTKAEADQVFYEIMDGMEERIRAGNPSLMAVMSDLKLPTRLEMCIRDRIKTPRGWWYRYADGAYPANKWLTINHHWYLFNPDGYMCTGWHRWNGSVCDPADGSGDWYYFDNTVDGPLEGACWHTHENGAQEIWYVE